MEIKLFPEQTHGLQILATAKATTIEGVALALITRGLKELLTDEILEQAAVKDRERVNRFLAQLNRQ